MIKITL
jgi:hypothetical protein